MTPEAFALLIASCGLNLPPGITTDRLRAYAQVESRLTPAAVSPPNRDGSRDYGLMQINAQHFRRFGVDAQTVMAPCVNLRIGAAILADADRQAREHIAACLYNSGRADCRRPSGTNGYPERIQAAASARGLYNVNPSASAPAQPTRKGSAEPFSPAPHSWDVWAMPALEPARPPPAIEVEAAEPRVIVELLKGD